MKKLATAYAGETKRYEEQIDKIKKTRMWKIGECSAETGSGVWKRSLKKTQCALFESVVDYCRTAERGLKV